MCAGRLSGTGTWLLRRQEFLQWESSTTSEILWLHGIPGSGKSKIVSVVVDHLTQRHPEDGIAYFYCMRSPAEPQRANPDEILRSLIRQLASKGSMITEPVKLLYLEKEKEAIKYGGEPEQLTVAESTKLLLALSTHKSMTIIIDALDECDPHRRHELLEVLDQIIQHASKAVKFFVSSRNDGDIVCRLEASPNVTIQAIDNGQDIERFVQDEVDQAIKNRRLLQGTVSEELRDKIIMTLNRSAQGM
jgi:Cdc6-like AAA superfamily ATPase